MASAVPRTPVVLNLNGAEAHQATTTDGLVLLDVGGVLDAPALRSWSRLLESAIAEGAPGVVVDLRGCRAIDLGFLSALVVASAKLKRRGDRGINLVTSPGSQLERRVGATAAGRLPAYSSAAEALRSFRTEGDG